MLVRHSIAYAIARGVPGLIGFATVVIYTRLLSPEAYGLYALVFTGSMLCNVILYQWLSASLIRFIPESTHNEAELLSSILSGYFAASAVAGFPRHGIDQPQVVAQVHAQTHHDQRDVHAIDSV